MSVCSNCGEAGPDRWVASDTDGDIISDISESDIVLAAVAILKRHTGIATKYNPFSDVMGKLSIEGQVYSCWECDTYDVEPMTRHEYEKSRQLYE